MKPVACVISLQEYAPFQGGMARYSEGVVHALGEKYQVEVFTGRTAQTQSPNVHALRLWGRFALEHVAGSLQLFTWLLFYQPQVIITTDALSLRALTPLRWLLPAQTWAVIHGTDVLDAAQGTGAMSLEDWGYIQPFLRGVLANSQYTAQLFSRELAPQLPHHIEVEILYPPLLDTLAKTTAKQKSATVEIVSVGRLADRKGFLFALTALAHAQNLPAYHYTIIGHGPQAKALQAMIDQHQLPVTLVTQADHAERQRLLAQADLYLQPSLAVNRPGQRVEGFGMTVIEAAQQGLPLLVSNHGGLPEAAGKAGLIFAENEADDFLNKLNVLLSNPEKRKQYAKQAKQHAQQFSLARFTDTLASYLSRPRLMFATEWFRPLLGGAGEQALQQARILQKDNQISLVTKRLPKTVATETVAGLAVDRVGLPQSGRWSDYRLLLQMAWYVWQRQPDILHLHGSLMNNFAVGALLGAKLRGRPIVSKVAVAGELQFGNESQTFTWRQRLNPLNAWRRWLALRATAYIAISQAIVAELQQMGVKPDRLHYLPNGVDTATFKATSAHNKSLLRTKLKLPAGKTIYLCVSRLVLRKGLLELVTWWQQHAPAGAFLLVVGSGYDQFDSIEKTLQDQMADSPTCRLLPPTLDIVAYYQASDVYITLSSSEGLANTVLEALACGLPVIARPISGMKDVLHQTDSVPSAGFLVNNDAELQIAVETYTKRTARQAASQAALATSQRFTLTDTVAQLQVLYTALRK